jgi:hypothetical protein
MRLSLAFSGLIAAVAAQSFDLTGAYWDVSVTTQTGRPGYEIKDVTASFHNPLAEENKAGKCHYSFVPNNGRPSITDTCDEGLAYTWDCESDFFRCPFVSRIWSFVAKIAELRFAHVVLSAGNVLTRAKDPQSPHWKRDSHHVRQRGTHQLLQRQRVWRRQGVQVEWEGGVGSLLPS